MSKPFPSLEPTGPSQQGLRGFGFGWGLAPWWANEEAEIPREEVTCSRSPQSPLCGTRNCFLPSSHSLPQPLPPDSFPQDCKSRAGTSGGIRGIWEAWEEFWAVKRVGGVHADLWCMWGGGRGIMAPRGPGSRFGTEIRLLFTPYSCKRDPRWSPHVQVAPAISAESTECAVPRPTLSKHLLKSLCDLR